MIIGPTLREPFPASGEATALRNLGVDTYVLAIGRNARPSEIEQFTSRDKIYRSLVDKIENVRPNILQKLVGGEHKCTLLCNNFLHFLSSRTQSSFV